MSRHEKKVGVRELRQNLSVYLGHVAEQGEVYAVTAHGRPVAILGPIPGEGSPSALLIAEGRAIPARGDLAALEPPRGRSSRRTSTALEREREERI